MSQLFLIYVSYRLNSQYQILISPTLSMFWFIYLTATSNPFTRSSQSWFCRAPMGRDWTAQSKCMCNLVVVSTATNVESLTDPTLSRPRNLLSAMWQYWRVSPMCVEDIYICIYIYTAVCKNSEPLIYISIYIYGVYCGKVLILENIPGHKKIINM